MQEEQEEHQEKEREKQEENGLVGELEDPSLADDQEPTAEEEPVDEVEEESEFVEEAEEKPGEELVQRRGCLRGCLFPVIAIFVILLVMVMIVYAKRNVISQWLRQRIIANTQNHVLSDLPEEDKKDIEAAFEKVKIALKEGNIDEEALDETIEEYQDSMQKRPSPEEKKQAINTLTDGLDAAIIVPEE